MNVKPLTYRQLLEALKELPEESLNMTVTVIDASASEAYPVYETTLVSELPTRLRQEFEDSLDLDQPALVM